MNRRRQRCWSALLLWLPFLLGFYCSLAVGWTILSRRHYHSDSHRLLQHHTSSRHPSAEPPQQQRQSIVGALFGANQDEEESSSDLLLLVQSIRACKTTSDIEERLHEVFFGWKNQAEQDNENIYNNNKAWTTIPLSVSSVALRHLAHLTVAETCSGSNNTTLPNNDFSGANNTSDNRNVSTTTTTTNVRILAPLLESVGTRLVLAKRRTEKKNDKNQETARLDFHQDDEINVYCLADIVQALAVLSSQQQQCQAEKMRPLAMVVITLLNYHHPDDLYRLGPIRLVQLLQAMATLGLPGQQHDHDLERNASTTDTKSPSSLPSSSSSSSSHDIWSLRRTIDQRLLKPDAVSKLPARFLAHGLSALAAWEEGRISKYFCDDDGNDANSTSSTSSSFLLTKSFMRRMCKPKVRQEATLKDWCRGLDATRCLQLALHDEDVVQLKDEFDKFTQLALYHVLELKEGQSFTNNKELSSLWTATQFVAFVSAWAELPTQRRDDEVLVRLLDVCTVEKTLERCSLWKLQEILCPLDHGSMTNHSKFTAGVGQQFMRLIMDDEAHDLINVPPESVNEILRWSVLMQRTKRGQQDPSFAYAANHLFSREQFLERCNLLQLGNFAWYLASTPFPEEDALVCLGRRLLEEGLSESPDCTPGLSSRILAHYTSSVGRFLSKSTANRTFEALQEVHSNIFDSFGPILLLSSSLSTSEASMALKAYAEAAFFVREKDEGILDHLVAVLGAFRERCTVRQLSQSLWSCGRLVAWEKHNSPPYVENAKNLAKELSSRSNKLTSADTAQAIWAIGRLNLREKDLIPIFSHRAIHPDLEPSLVEISNVLWGMAQLRYRNGRVIKTLLNRVMILIDNGASVSPQEASAILYSLGQFEWKDEGAFDVLAGVILDQIESASAQSVANTLYAFRCVHSKPPRQLLDNWANQLGIVSIVPTLIQEDQAGVCSDMIGKHHGMGLSIDEDR